MAASDAAAPRITIGQRSSLRRIANYLYKHPTISLILLLLPTLLWLGVVYFGSLSALLVQSFFYLDDFSGRIVRQFSTRTYAQLFQQANTDIVLRTVGMAAAVTLVCALIAFPLAYYMARYASYRVKGLLYLGVMLPLWSSYLVRVYAWKLILAQEGIITWLANGLGLGGALQWLLDLPGIGGSSLSFSYIGLFVVFVYIWLPYMILPISTALERVPKSVIEASGDLGARPGLTFRKVILPLAFPGVVAGSIFTFSLTLGDYIIPGVFGNSSYFIGQAVYIQQGTSGNIPLAAAFTVVPVIIMSIYLLLARRLGAFDAI
ncbi:MAG: ABC transporter permease subunit [Chloroflexi bacterium]|nr:ABC transporter permease subunit [Chloroflexota bacterium]